MVSPYAPVGRRLPSETGGEASYRARAAATAIAVLVFAYRFWRKRPGGTGKDAGSGSSLLRLCGRVLEGARPVATAGTTCAAAPREDSSGPSLVEIRENNRAISGVLGYWFGQNPPETSQKALWMIASSSVEHRKKIDAEVAARFEGLLLELARGRGSRRWEQWCLDPEKIYGARGKIAAVVVLDQCSRHVLRHHNGGGAGSGGSHLPPQESLDTLALETARLLERDHLSELRCGMVPLPMRVFALMPYRHAGTMESVEHAMAAVEEMADLEQQNGAMVGRFRKATNRRLAVLQDERRRTGTGGEGTAGGVDGKAGSSFSDDAILEVFPFEADMEPAPRHPVHKTIADFLATQGIHPRAPGRAGGSNASEPRAGDAIVVSLSGGVDSMVIASVLADLKRSRGYDHLAISAVHIDYANRPESGAEADYVRRYCEHHLGGAISFVCRRIGEVTRGVTARDDYERIAREIRYDSYREAVARAREGLGLLPGGGPRTVGVVLGHHRGDLRENVLSNAHKGCGPLDLSGMTAVSRNDGITVFRPLLPLEKSLVFDYAHRFGVPYYKDTTPHWSTRGKLRNKLLPLLEEIYGDGSMNNLSNLAVESDECRALMNKSMIAPFLDSIVRRPMGIVLDTSAWKDQPLFFWKVVLREALHSAGLGMFSDKSVLEFLKRIQATKPKAAWLQCRKDYGVYLQEDGRVYVLYPSSFPWSKKDAYRVDGQVVEFGTDRTVGSWKVRSEVLSDSAIESLSQPPAALLERRAVPSMDSLMDGNIEYFVKASTRFEKDKESGRFVPRSLVFRTFSKADRPRAWKSCDLRIQSTLPVLGNDKDLEGAMEDTGDPAQTPPDRLVRVTIGLVADREGSKEE